MFCSMSSPSDSPIFFGSAIYRSFIFRQTALSLRYGSGRVYAHLSVGVIFREMTLHRTGHQSELILGAEQAAMRQIAWELVQTLDEHDRKTK